MVQKEINKHFSHLYQIQKMRISAQRAILDAINKREMLLIRQKTHCTICFSFFQSAHLVQLQCQNCESWEKISEILQIRKITSQKKASKTWCVPSWTETCTFWIMSLRYVINKYNTMIHIYPLFCRCLIPLEMARLIFENSALVSPRMLKGLCKRGSHVSTNKPKEK